MNLSKLNATLFILTAIILLTSCNSSLLTINKRRYNKGYYVNIKSSISKPSDIKISTIEKYSNSNTTKQSLLIASSSDNINEFNLNEPEDISYYTTIPVPNDSIDGKEEETKLTLKKIFDPSFDIGNFVPSERQTKKYVLKSFFLGFTSWTAIALSLIFLVFPAFLLSFPLIMISLYYNFLAKKHYAFYPEYTKRKWLLNISFVLGAIYLILLVIILNTGAGIPT